MKRTFKKITAASILISLLTIAAFPVSVFAQEEHDSTDDFVLISDQGSEQYYLSEDELLKVEINDVSVPQTRSQSNEAGELTKSVTKDIKFYSTDVTEEERDELLAEARSGNLTKTNQGMNSMGNIRSNLSVSYSYMTAAGKQGLHLCKATASYTRLSMEGVVVNSGNLTYGAAGSIYSYGSFVRNDDITGSYSGTTFSNKQLMPEGTCVVDLMYGGVNYTIYCTRGVTVYVDVTF